jgi:hypothetical protein
MVQICWLEVEITSFSLKSCLHYFLLCNDQVERDFLKSGFIQVLPYRDSAGRRIITALGNFGAVHHTLKNKVRDIL